MEAVEWWVTVEITRKSWSGSEDRTASKVEAVEWVVVVEVVWKKDGAEVE